MGDVATDVRDLYQPTKEKHLPYIGLEHIEQQTLRLLGVGDSRDVQSIKKRFKNGDVLFWSLRVYFRKVIRSKIDGVCSTDITVLRPKNAQLDPMFLFYLVGNNQFIDRATGQGEGTRMPRAGWSVISDFDIEIPKEIGEQKRIAEILSTFDEMIENNNRIIKTLEEMAQAIFRKRFGVFPEALSKGWEMKKLGDLGRIITGKTPSTKDKENFGNNYPFITIPDLQNGVFVVRTERFLSEQGAGTMSASKLPVGAICVSCIATVGLVAIATRESFTNQQINSIIPKSEVLRPFVFLLLRGMRSGLQAYASGGTAAPIISKGAFEKI